MQIEIDIDQLSSDERYHLYEGLIELKSPSSSCKKALARLTRLSNKEFDEHLRKYPGDWISFS